MTDHIPIAPSPTTTPKTWQELAEAVFPNSRPMTPEERESFDRLAWADATPIEIDSGPASAAPAPPRESYAPQSGANDVQGTTPAFRSFTPPAASPAQEATPPRPTALIEAEVHLGELATGPKAGRPDYVGVLSLADAVALRDELARLRTRVAVLSSAAAVTPPPFGATP